MNFIFFNFYFKTCLKFLPLPFICWCGHHHSRDIKPRYLINNAHYLLSPSPYGKSVVTNMNEESGPSQDNKTNVLCALFVLIIVVVTTVVATQQPRPGNDFFIRSRVCFPSWEGFCHAVLDLLHAHHVRHHTIGSKHNARVQDWELAAWPVEPICTALTHCFMLAQARWPAGLPELIVPGWAR